MRLLIVIVNYNGFDLTVDCLRSLRAELQRLPDARVGLCDNGSRGDDAMRLRSVIDELGLSDRVELTALPINRGFTGGNNAVIAPALQSDTPPDAVFLLNNDTIIGEGSITELVRFMDEHPDVGLCGSRLVWPDGQSQSAARRVLTVINELDSYARIGLLSRLLKPWGIVMGERDQPHIAGWIPGAALLIRREVLEKVGLLDEGLYTYFDDVDYCLRAKRAGWPTWYVPQSRIVHLVGKTTGITSTDVRPKRRAAYWFLARRRYYLKNFGPIYAALADAAAILGLLLHRLKLLISRRPDPDPPGLIADMIRHSVFRTGFKITDVPNPALQQPATA